MDRKGISIDCPKCGWYINIVEGEQVSECKCNKPIGNIDAAIKAAKEEYEQRKESISKNNGGEWPGNRKRHVRQDK